MTASEIESLEKRLLVIDTEREQIISKLKKLRKTINISSSTILGKAVTDKIPSAPEEKIALFLKLFKCRESVYPKLWENDKKGTKGYSPVCANEWIPNICNKPKIKCTDCHHRLFRPLDSTAVNAHLRGEMTIGTYAIREDDTCTFLACDFDEKSWPADVALYKSEANKMGLDVAVERSRSGNGAHAWIFFTSPIPARLARALGTVILSRCATANYAVSLESYDRFFPNQDYLPKGGFGNLIALPLQLNPRKSGNSVFIDNDGTPFENQWEFLSKIRAISLMEVRHLIDEYLPSRNQLKSPEDDLSEMSDQNILADSKESLKTKDILIGAEVEIIQNSNLEILLDNLPSPLVTKLKKTASFPNPEFYHLQRMRMSTYPHRRFIFSGEIRPDRLILPRGVLDKVIKIFNEAGARTLIRDERMNKKGLKVSFNGVLTNDQESAVSTLKKHDIGILCAPPGTGKTVMGCALIAARKTPSLILVHRQPLVSQWKERIVQFLGVDKKDIGIWGGSKKKRTGKIDIIMLQSLTRSEEIETIVSDYSQLIIDECHHIPATSFEAILKLFRARYVVGLTATPYRKDKLEKILFHQCGPIRHEIKVTDNQKLEKNVRVKELVSILPEHLGLKPAYHLIADFITHDQTRNEVITNDLFDAVKNKRFPLVVSDRKDHLDLLSVQLKLKAEGEKVEVTIFKMDGELTNKKREKMLEEILVTKVDSRSVVIFATASLIGEGFDLPSLDTLFLTMPLSFRGRMVQYAGRLHRTSSGKSNVLIYDYLDLGLGVAIKMFRSRMSAYKEMGYSILQVPISQSQEKLL